MDTDLRMDEKENNVICSGGHSPSTTEDNEPDLDEKKNYANCGGHPRDAAANLLSLSAEFRKFGSEITNTHASDDEVPPSSGPSCADSGFISEEGSTESNTSEATPGPPSYTNPFASYVPTYDRGLLSNAMRYGSDFKWSCKLLIRHLNATTSKKKLKAYFQRWGDVVDCTTMRVSINSRDGHVIFSRPLMVVDVLDALPHEIDGQEVEITQVVPTEYANDPEQFCKLFVGGLNYKTSEETLIAHFEQWGEIVDCEVIRDSRRARAFGFVSFKRPHTVVEVLNVQSHEIDGREVEIKHSRPTKHDSESEDSRKLLIIGLNNETSDETLKAYFERWGEIVDCRVMRNCVDVELYRMFGYVTFKTAHMLDDAQVAGPHKIDGNELKTLSCLEERQTNFSLKDNAFKKDSPPAVSNFYTERERSKSGRRIRKPKVFSEYQCDGDSLDTSKRGMKRDSPLESLTTMGINFERRHPASSSSSETAEDNHDLFDRANKKLKNKKDLDERDEIQNDLFEISNCRDPGTGKYRENYVQTNNVTDIDDNKTDLASNYSSVSSHNIINPGVSLLKKTVNPQNHLKLTENISSVSNPDKQVHTRQKKRKPHETRKERANKFIKKREMRFGRRPLSAANNTGSKRRLVEDFLLPALEDKRFGDYLHWEDRENGIFRIFWDHKSKGEWSKCHNIVFFSWDAFKGRFNVKNDPECVQSKQRVRAALRNVSKKVQCDVCHETCDLKGVGKGIRTYKIKYMESDVLNENETANLSDPTKFISWEQYYEQKDSSPVCPSRITKSCICYLTNTNNPPCPCPPTCACKAKNKYKRLMGYEEEEDRH